MFPENGNNNLKQPEYCLAFSKIFVLENYTCNENIVTFILFKYISFVPLIFL